MRKIIFLDIDGVLNTKFWYGQGKKDKYGPTFDPTAVANLKKILDETGADIVISSSWKSFGLSMLQRMWKYRNLPSKIIDVTPDCLDDEMLLHVDLDNVDLLYNRGCEIKVWLKKHEKDISHYVILDDVKDILPEQESYFVWVDPDSGITKGNVVQAIMILNK